MRFRWNKQSLERTIEQTDSEWTDMGKQVDRENVPDNLSHHHFIICDVSLEWQEL